MRYDFGGGCRDLAYDEDITIVDIQPFEGYDCIDNCAYGPEKKCKRCKYIIQDIFSENLTLPQMSSFINISMVLRYFAGQDDGYLDSSIIDNIKLKQVGNNIIKYMRPGGIVRIFDNMNVIEDVIQVLVSNNFNMISCKLINPRDRDYGAEWEVILIK